MKNNLFIHEDGSVIEVHDDATDGKRKRGKSPQKSPNKKKQKTKLVACGECEGCLKKACKKCDACKRKKRCSLRKCSNIKRVVISDGKESNGKNNDESDEDVEDEVEPKTPRIRIRVGKSSTSKKRKATPKQDEDGDEPESGDSQNASSRKRARLNNGRRSPAVSEQSGEDDEQLDEMFDIETLEEKYNELSKATFEEARNNFTLHGPWRLPTDLESNSAAFKEIAKTTLINITR